MKKAIGLVLVACVVMMAGCVAAKQSLTLSIPYDRETAQKQMSPGKNTIIGSAMLKTRGGDVKTCAGEAVAIFPYIPYTVSVFYQTHGGGFRPIYSGDVDKTNLDHDFLTYRKKSICNPQGGFKFENLADGSYYVLTRVVWEAPEAGYQGGELVERVDVSGGETKEIVITAQ
jgi:hypothetical protein